MSATASSLPRELVTAASQGNLNPIRNYIQENKKWKIDSRDMHGRTMLIYATKGDHKDVVKFLLEKGAAVDGRDNEEKTPLIYASDRGYKELVLLFLEQKANVDARCREGKTSLIYACYNNRKEIIKILIDHNVKINITDVYGRSALHYSAYKKFDVISKVLLENGANPNIQSMDGTTPLMTASLKKSLDVMKLMIDKGAMVNLQSADGTTALILAAIYGQKDQLEVLIAAGARLDIADYSGVAALTYASNHFRQGGSNEAYLYLADLSKKLLHDTEISISASRPSSSSKKGRTKEIAAPESVESSVNADTGDSLTISELEIQLALNQGKRAWNRSKIMIVGQGRAGKTALANSLIGKRFEETTSTVGINQLSCDVKVASVGNSATWDVCSPPPRELELAVAKTVAANRLQLQQQTDPNNRATLNMDLDMSRVFPSNLDAEPSDVTLESLIDAMEGISLGGTFSEGGISEKNDTRPLTQQTTLNIDVDESALIKCLAQNVQFNSKYMISIFDFGGQSIFDVIHPFFLTHYGIYIVTFNMEWLLPSMKDTKEYQDCLQYISFWLNNIVVHTQDKEHGHISPIFFVGTRKDKVKDVKLHEDISTTLYQHFSHNLAWSSIVENIATDGQNGKIDLFFFPVDNRLGRDNDPIIQKLLQCIEKEIDQATYVHTEYPLTWFKTFDEMMATGKSVLSYQETEKIAMNCGMFNVASNSSSTMPANDDQSTFQTRMLSQFLLFLHQMGMLMWHQEDRLRDIVILQPIEYFVRPATVVICKHEPTIHDNLYHSLPIHKKVKKIMRYEWDQMVKYGFISSKLIQVMLLPSSYSSTLANDVDMSYGCVNMEHLEMVIGLMIKYGLIVELGISLLEQEPSTPRTNSAATFPTANDIGIDLGTNATLSTNGISTVAERHFLAPALLPKRQKLDEPTAEIDASVSDDVSGGSKSNITNPDEEVLTGERNEFYFVFAIQHKYFDPPGYALSNNNTNSTGVGGVGSSHSCALITLEDCKIHGFLPSGFFERLICKAVSWSQETTLQDDNASTLSSASSLLRMQIYSLSKDEAWLAYGSQRFQMKLYSRHNIIKVTVEGTNPVPIYSRLKDQVELVISECMNTLKFFTALPLNLSSTNASSSSTSLLLPWKDIRNAAQRYSSLHLLPLQSNPMNPACGITNKKSVLTTVEIHDIFSMWLEDLNHNHKASSKTGANLEYDVFLSYRWGSNDSLLVNGLFDRFTLYTLLPSHRALYVFLDCFRLTTGKNFQDEFALALVQSKVFVPTVSVDALQRMIQHDPLVVDNVMVEWILAHFAVVASKISPASKLKRIIPILIGQRTSASITGGHVNIGCIFASGALNQLSATLHPTASVALAKTLLIRYGVPFDESDMNTLTVKGVVERMIQNLAIDASKVQAELSSNLNGNTTTAQLLNVITSKLVKNVQECVLLECPDCPDSPSPTEHPTANAVASSAGPTSGYSDDSNVVPFTDLSVSDVGHLLTRIGLPMYRDAFESNMVDGRALVECIDENDLKDAGIDKAFHARKLMAFIKDWKTSSIPGVPKNMIAR